MTTTTELIARVRSAIEQVRGDVAYSRNLAGLVTISPESVQRNAHSTELIDAARQLCDVVEGMERDAARYQWIREQATKRDVQHSIEFISRWGSSWQFDNAVDAARKGDRQ